MVVLWSTYELILTLPFFYLFYNDLKAIRRVFILFLYFYPLNTSLLISQTITKWFSNSTGNIVNCVFCGIENELFFSLKLYIYFFLFFKGQKVNYLNLFNIQSYHCFYTDTMLMGIFSCCLLTDWQQVN